jgi:hypothetical protein
MALPNWEIRKLSGHAIQTKTTTPKAPPPRKKENTSKCGSSRVSFQNEHTVEQDENDWEQPLREGGDKQLKEALEKEAQRMGGFLLLSNYSFTTESLDVNSFEKEQREREDAK